MLEAGQNRNISLRTSGSGKININLQDLTSLVDKVGGQREEHSGAVLSGRLEAVESQVSGLTGEEGRLLLACLFFSSFPPFQLSSYLTPSFYLSSLPSQSPGPPRSVSTLLTEDQTSPSPLFS